MKKLSKLLKSYDVPENIIEHLVDRCTEAIAADSDSSSVYGGSDFADFLPYHDEKSLAGYIMGVVDGLILSELVDNSDLYDEAYSLVYNYLVHGFESCPNGTAADEDEDM